MISNLNEPDFILLLKSGDTSAYQQLITVYKKTVYNTCLNLLQNSEDAEDICQEVFVTVFQSIHQFKGASKLTTWVYRIAVTKSLDYVRMKKRKKRFGFMRSIFSEESNEPIYDRPNFIHPGVLLENKERTEILFRAIDQLPENQKTAFVLSKLEQLSYVEVAEVMEVTVSSVESLLFRAKQNLKKILGDYYKENEK